MTRKYTKGGRSRDNLLDRDGKNSIHYRIKNLTTLEEKRDLVIKTNPFLYIFGEKLIPQQHLSYADWIAKQYLGD